MIAKNDETAYAAWRNFELDKCTEIKFREIYCGLWPSELAFATDLFYREHMAKIPQGLRSFIDHEEFRHSIFRHEYYSLRAGSAVWIFRNI